MCAKKFAEIRFSKRWVRSSSLRKEMASPATEQQPRKSPRGSSSRFDPPNFQRYVCSPREPQTHTNRCLPTPGKLALRSKLACFLLAELAPKEVSIPPLYSSSWFVLHHHFAHLRTRPPIPGLACSPHGKLASPLVHAELASANFQEREGGGSWLRLIYILFVGIYKSHSTHFLTFLFFFWEGVHLSLRVTRFAH